MIQKFFIALFIAFELLACQKPKCPTYMTPQEFAAFQQKRDSKRYTKRDRNGHIKKKQVSVDKVR
ncbi:MAG: hypothetical protein SFU27_08615 [Thermonemataceae bacterium]|nr:hypothetical protein [Thermonemataceae bacterium]